MIAVGLLATIALSVAQLFAVAGVATSNARARTSTSILAAQKMEQLRALSWGVDVQSETRRPLTDTRTDLSTDPPAAGGSGLKPSPAGALNANTPGFGDFLDASGRWVGNGARPPSNTSYVRRWAITPLPAHPNDTLVFQVLVTTLRREARYVSSGPRQRVADDAWLVSVKTRKAR